MSASSGNSKKNVIIVFGVAAVVIVGAAAYFGGKAGSESASGTVAPAVRYKADKDGGTVEDRPISVVDFMATVCTLMGIDHTKQIQTGIGRPIRLVDKGAKLVEVC